jgi:hypothetical protein
MSDQPRGKSRTGPIHITIDVNVKVQKDLEDFFGDIDQARDLTKTTPTDVQ